MAITMGVDRDQRGQLDQHWSWQHSRRILRRKEELFTVMAPHIFHDVEEDEDPPVSLLFVSEVTKAM